MSSPPVVAITGASSGIGRATAHAFAANGASVGLIARNEIALAAAAREVEERGGRALVARADVADPDAVEQAAAAIEDAFGPIDVWVNNAMVTLFAPFATISAAEFRRVTEVTYLGTVYGTMSALRRMRERDRGTIVQVGSALAYRSIPLQSAYCGAKAAIRGFTDSIRSELQEAKSAVRMTAVHLPAVNTPQFVVQRNKLSREAQPVPPIFTPELAARSIVWAAEHAPREMLVGGSAVKAVYAQVFAPGFADMYLAQAGTDAQTLDEPNEPAPDNLFEPVPFDPGTHGPFGGRASDRSAQLWLRMNPRAVWLGLATVAAAVAAYARR